MKYISAKHPLSGYDFTDKENFDEMYNLATKLIEIVIEEKRSYAEACEAFDIAKEGLKTLKITYY